MFIMSMDYRMMPILEETYSFGLFIGEASVFLHLPKARNTKDDIPIEILEDVMANLLID